MATRDDIFIRFDLSPRVLRVEAPSTELIVQDLHDTSQDITDEPANIIYPEVIRTAGKEPLGGGVTVALTATLQNMIIAFDPRTTSVSQGTATAADADGLFLNDSSATFLTDLVTPGAVVVNFADESVGSVIFAVSETQLLLFPINRGSNRALDDGIDNDWDVGDFYKVWNIEQVSLSGGNTVAIDDNDLDIIPILPTFGTQVIQANSSSATQLENAAIQFSSFNGGITVDLTQTTSGLEFPIGTPQQPVGNFADALTLAALKGFRTLYIIGNAVIDSGLDFSDIRFVGESQTKSLFTINAAATILNAEFVEATITGTLDGGSQITGCQITTLDFVDGFIIECVLSGTITLSGIGEAHFLDCWSGIPGQSTPTINMGGAGSALALRNYNGGITLTNHTGLEDVTIDLNSGQVILDSTITDGTFVIRGTGKLTDNSTGSAVVFNELQSDKLDNIDSNVSLILTDTTLLTKVNFNRLEVDITSQELILYDDDGSTVLQRWALATNGGELVATATGVQTKRGPKIL